MKNASATTVGWFVGRLPEGWFTEAPEITYDRDEVLVVGRVAEPAHVTGAEAEARTAACRARIDAFREETRAARMAVADAAEARFGRKVAWGTACGDERVIFTSLSVPVMTRLRMSERQVLDTLVEANVARSRSDALGWCVRLVREHEGEWIDRLRAALVEVDRVRGDGPGA